MLALSSYCPRFHSVRSYTCPRVVTLKWQSVSFRPGRVTIHCDRALTQTYSNRLRLRSEASVSLNSPIRTPLSGRILTQQVAELYRLLLQLRGRGNACHGRCRCGHNLGGLGVIGALTKGIGCFFAGSTWDRSAVDLGTGARRFYHSYRSWS